MNDLEFLEDLERRMVAPILVGEIPMATHECVRLGLLAGATNLAFLGAFQTMHPDWVTRNIKKARERIAALVRWRLHE